MVALLLVVISVTINLRFASSTRHVLFSCYDVKNSTLQHNVPISGYVMLVEASPAVSDFVMMATLLVPSQKSYSIVVTFEPEYEAGAAISHRVQYTLAVLNREGENHSDILTKSHLLFP
jgi:hypothetical protein